MELLFLQHQHDRGQTTQHQLGPIVTLPQDNSNKTRQVTQLAAYREHVVLQQFRGTGAQLTLADSLAMG